MRVITLNVNGIRSAERKGLRPLARAHRPLGRRLPAGDQGRRDDVPRAAARAAAVARGVLSGGKEGLQRRGTLRASRGRASPPASATTSSMPRAATSRRTFAHAHRHLPLPALGVERTAPPGVQVPLSRRLPAASRAAARQRARDPALRRLEHRAPADRPQELAQQPEELGLPARGARVADPGLRRAGLRRRLPPPRPAAGAVHVVVESRPGLGEERRLADRLPDRHAGTRGHRDARPGSTPSAGSATTRR